MPKSKKIKKSTKKLLIILFSVLILILISVSGYLFFPQIGTLSKKEELDLKEATIKYVMWHNASGLQQKVKTFFIGFGKDFNPELGIFKFEDPDHNFLKRFNNVQVPVCPIDEAVKNGIGGFACVKTKDGKDALVIAAGNIIKKTCNIAIVKGFYYEGGLSSAAYDVTIIRTPLGWFPIRSKLLWIS